MLKTILTGNIESALFQVEYDKLEDDTFSGRIPGSKGVIASGIHYANVKANCSRLLKIGFSLV